MTDSSTSSSAARAAALPEPTAADDVLELAPTIEGEEFSRVAFTQAAVEMLQQLIARHGPLMFHRSGGCCDGSCPMCYPAGEFLTGDADVRMGHGECPCPTARPARWTSG